MVQQDVRHAILYDVQACIWMRAAAHSTCVPFFNLTGDAAALLGAAANGASLSIGRALLLAPYHVPVFAYSFVVTGAPPG